jgi:hypothetical protein
MGRASNTLKGSDVTTTPIRLKYSQSYSSNTMNDYGISVYNGTNTPVGIDGNFTQEFLNYASAKQLYYKSYISGSLLDSGSGYNDNLQSTAASGTFDNDFRIFPTASNSTIATLSIPMSAFGERIARRSFNITFDNFGYHLVDDGNGNIIDLDNSNVHVGNILYAQGMVIITNATYVSTMTPLYNDFSFYINNISNTAGNISVKITMPGFQQWRTTPAPSTVPILSGSNLYELDAASPPRSVPTNITFQDLINTSGSGNHAMAVIFDSINPIGTDPAQKNNYAYNTLFSPTSSDAFGMPIGGYNTDAIFLPTSSTGIAPILETALVPIKQDGLSIVFNHFDTTLNPGARVVIYDYSNPSSIFFDKTVSQIVADNTYAYLIEYTSPNYLAVEIYDVTRADGSSSPIKVFTFASPSGPFNGTVFYQEASKDLFWNLIFSSGFFPYQYPNINIQLEYAS